MDVHPTKIIIIGFDPPPYRDIWGVLHVYKYIILRTFSELIIHWYHQTKGRCTNRGILGIFRHVAEGIPIRETESPEKDLKDSSTEHQRFSVKPYHFSIKPYHLLSFVKMNTVKPYQSVLKVHQHVPGSMTNWFTRDFSSEIQSGRLFFQLRKCEQKTRQWCLRRNLVSFKWVWVKM